MMDGNSHPVRAGDLKGMKLLLVEDDEINQEIAEVILSDMECWVDICQDGESAVSAVQITEYDAVLMDIQMPVMDGYEAAKQIRALGGRFASLPIIAMTGNGLSRDRKMSLDAGMNDHITKPFDPDNIFAVLSHWLGLESTQTDLSSQKHEYKMDVPGIDMVSAMERFANDLDLYRKVFASFCDKHANSDSVIKSFIDEEDWVSAARCAHNLKGTSGNLDAEKITKCAGCIEVACRNKDRVRAEKYVVELRRHLDTVLLGVGVISSFGSE